MWLLEHWERMDLDEWAAGQRTAPLPEGLVLGHQGYRDDEVGRLQDENPQTKVFDYYNVTTYPPNEWLNGGNAFFDYMGTQLGKGLIWIDPTTGYQGQYMNTGRMVVRWADNAQEAAEVMVGAARGRHGVFLDVYWPAGPHQWMFNDQGGKFDIARVDPALVEQHRATLVALPGLLSKAGVVLTNNGDIEHPLPTYGQAARFFEGVGNFAHHPFDIILPKWKANAGNVLSVFADNPTALDRALNEWLRWGGWLSFTTQTEGTAGTAAVRAAYTKARELRQSLVVAPPTEPEPGPDPGPGGGPGNAPDKEKDK